MPFDAVCQRILSVVGPAISAYPFLRLLPPELFQSLFWAVENIAMKRKQSEQMKFLDIKKRFK
jgi:hypothetical protein